MSSEKLTEAEQSVISALSRAVNRGRQSMAATLAAAEAKLFPAHDSKTAESSNRMSEKRNLRSKRGSAMVRGDDDSDRVSRANLRKSISPKPNSRLSDPSPRSNESHTRGKSFRFSRLVKKGDDDTTHAAAVASGTNQDSNSSKQSKSSVSISKSGREETNVADFLEINGDDVSNKSQKRSNSHRRTTSPRLTLSQKSSGSHKSIHSNDGTGSQKGSENGSSKFQFKSNLTTMKENVASNDKVATVEATETVDTRNESESEASKKTRGVIKIREPLKNSVDVSNSKAIDHDPIPSKSEDSTHEAKPPTTVTPSKLSPSPRAAAHLHSESHPSNHSNTPSSSTHTTEHATKNKIENHCEICNLTFKSLALYEKHVQYSDLHQRTVAKITAQKEEEERKIIKRKIIDCHLKSFCQYLMIAMEISDSFKSQLTRFGKKPISISPRYRWHTAISKVIMQLAVEDTKGVLFRQHTEDKNKSISITDQLNKSYLIFDGQKFYWRTKFSIHLQIILHEYDQTVNTARDNDGRKNAKAEAAKDNKGAFSILEVIAYDNEEMKELKRLYMHYQNVLEYIGMNNFSANLNANMGNDNYMSNAVPVTPRTARDADGNALTSSRRNSVDLSASVNQITNLGEDMAYIAEAICNRIMIEPIPRRAVWPTKRIAFNTTRVIIPDIDDLIHKNQNKKKLTKKLSFNKKNATEDQEGESEQEKASLDPSALFIEEGEFLRRTVPMKIARRRRSSAEEVAAVIADIAKQTKELAEFAKNYENTMKSDADSTAGTIKVNAKSIMNSSLLNGENKDHEHGKSVARNKVDDIDSNDGKGREDLKKSGSPPMTTDNHIEERGQKSRQANESKPRKPSLKTNNFNPDVVQNSITDANTDKASPKSRQGSVVIIT